MLTIKSIRALKLVTPSIALITMTIQIISVTTNDWLNTVELMPNPNYEKFNRDGQLEFWKKFTTSGLWNLCHNEPPDSRMHCFRIDYFSQEEYIPDQNDSTMAMPYSMKQAAIYIWISTILLALGQSIYFFSQICRGKQIYILISGIPFILSGLFILTGIVVYISTFKNEIGNKLRPLSQFQDALFDYRYGYSFLFLVASILLSELSGTLTIFLYVSQKHFQILIDMERDEVLKSNLINLFRNNCNNNDQLYLRQQQQQRRSDGRLSVEIDYQGSSSLLPKPKFLISSVEDYQPDPSASRPDEEEGEDVLVGTSNQTRYELSKQSPIQHSNIIADSQFLTPDYHNVFGGNSFDPAYYQCGRHGTRGRRNSRSNESFLSSPLETSDYIARRSSFSQFNFERNPSSSLVSQQSKNLEGDQDFTDHFLPFSTPRDKRDNFTGIASKQDSDVLLQDENVERKFEISNTVTEKCFTFAAESDQSEPITKTGRTDRSSRLKKSFSSSSSNRKLTFQNQLSVDDYLQNCRKNDLEEKISKNFLNRSTLV
ncbi:Voltage-dependent calcium channel gamma-5 subunit [Sarcoptes scabiei]|uniref:Voltage-dependent calcium channel gamma-5 subunit n=1 Tax=Sarcoptes scabiei TaxID=52283 RepID=A0A834R2W8_SARSC|nr:Voltage-dependent calcium channel gamma-5 subunit [Sarcoptes scabiei]